MHKYLIGIAFAAVTAFATPALGQPAEVTDGNARAVPVSYADLDLSRDDHANFMLSRLRYAAKIVCDAPDINQPSPAMRRDERACRSTALQSAVNRLGQPEVSRLHEERRR